VRVAGGFNLRKGAVRTLAPRRDNGPGVESLSDELRPCARGQLDRERLWDRSHAAPSLRTKPEPEGSGYPNEALAGSL
jgi:hypothetical protein